MVTKRPLELYVSTFRSVLAKILMVTKLNDWLVESIPRSVLAKILMVTKQSLNWFGLS